RTVSPGLVFRTYSWNALIETIGSPSTKLMRSLVRSPAFSAGDPGATSSTYGGVRSITFGTNRMPWYPPGPDVASGRFTGRYVPAIPLATNSGTESVTSLSPSLTVTDPLTGIA